MVRHRDKSKAVINKLLSHSPPVKSLSDLEEIEDLLNQACPFSRDNHYARKIWREEVNRYLSEERKKPYPKHSRGRKKSTRKEELQLSLF
jgi:hypothetical protein